MTNNNIVNSIAHEPRKTFELELPQIMVTPGL